MSQCIECIRRGERWVRISMHKPSIGRQVKDIPIFPKVLSEMLDKEEEKRNRQGPHDSWEKRENVLTRAGIRAGSKHIVRYIQHALVMLDRRDTCSCEWFHIGGMENQARVHVMSKWHLKNLSGNVRTRTPGTDVTMPVCQSYYVGMSL